MAHVGALQELEKIFKFVGYAGTSAGSLVALLAAACLTADEMANALKELDLKSLDVIGDPVRLMPVILGLGVLCFVAWLGVLVFFRHHPPALFEWLLAVVGQLYGYL